MATFESESDCFSVYVFSSSNKLEMMREVKSNLPSRQFGMHCARAHSLRQHDEAGPTLMHSFPRALGPPSFAAAADATRRPLEKRERVREQPRSTLVMVYNGHLITATLGSLDFFEIEIRPCLDF